MPDGLRSDDLAPLPAPRSRVTWWWIADNCRCTNNGHQGDAVLHPMADGAAGELRQECKHHRALTGYPATAVSAHLDERGRAVLELEVEMPAYIGPGSRHNLITRQAHSVLAAGRPRSGQCTLGTIDDELARHARRVAATAQEPQPVVA